MKKETNTLLLIGAGALAAYLLLPKAKEAIEGMMPEFPSIDLGALFPEGGVPLNIAYPEIDFGAAISDTMGELLASLGIGGGAGAEGGQPDIPIVPPDEIVSEKGWSDSVKGAAINIAEAGAILGATYIGFRYIAPPAARAVGGITERLASRLFQAKAAQTAAKVPTAGEALGPAAATKLPGQALKYAKPPWWARLFGIGGGRFMPAIAIIPVLGPGGTWRDPLIKMPGLNYPTGPAPGWVQAVSFYGPTQPLPYAPFTAAFGSLSVEGIINAFATAGGGGGGAAGGFGTPGYVSTRRPEESMLDYTKRMGRHTERGSESGGYKGTSMSKSEWEGVAASMAGGF